MSETCSVLGKVWKTISALISQQWPNMRSCFEPADRETHCWLSMIGTGWQWVAQSIWFEGGFCFFFLGDLFWKSNFWGGGKIPTIGVGQMGRRLKLWSVFDKVQTLGTRHSTCEMIQTLPQVGIVECSSWERKPLKADKWLSPSSTWDSNYQTLRVAGGRQSLGKQKFTIKKFTGRIFAYSRQMRCFCGYLLLELWT